MIAVNKVILSSASQSQLATSWQPDRPFFNHAIKKGYVVRHNPLILLVGTAGFELATPCTPCKCATRLRYAPKRAAILADFDDLSSILSCLTV